MQRLDKIYSAKIFGKYLQITVTEETNMFKVNNRNTRTWCEICSKLTIKTPERCSGAVFVNFEHISHL